MAIIRIQAAPSIRCRTIRTIGVISQLPGEKRDLNTGWSTYKRDEMVSNVPKLEESDCKRNTWKPHFFN